MNRALRSAVLVSVAGGMLACSSEAPAPVLVGGSAGMSSGAPSGTAGGGSSSGGAGAGAGGGGAGGGGGAAGTLGNGGAAGAAGGGGASGGGGGDANVPALPQRVLLYHFSTLVIDSVPAQLAILRATLEGWGFEVEESDAPADINATNLARFGGVAMINTCFEPFGAGQSGEPEAAALKAFVEGGGGLFGTHCASVTYQSASPAHPYNGVIGGRGGDGYFEGVSACRRTDEQHVTTEMLPATFDYDGNLDNADYLAPDTKVLVMCEWSGGAMKDTAVSWYRTPGKGRVFYTNFAKEDVDLEDPELGAKHILVGLGWVLGR